MQRIAYESLVLLLLLMEERALLDVKLRLTDVCVDGEMTLCAVSAPCLLAMLAGDHAVGLVEHAVMVSLSHRRLVWTLQVVAVGNIALSSLLLPLLLLQCVVRRYLLLAVRRRLEATLKVQSLLSEHVLEPLVSAEVQLCIIRIRRDFPKQLECSACEGLRGGSDRPMGLFALLDRVHA